jgi:hypothetical protein
MNRRNFVKNGITLAATAPFIGNLELESARKKNIGIQIYTIRDFMQKDATGLSKPSLQQDIKILSWQDTMKANFMASALKRSKHWQTVKA